MTRREKFWMFVSVALFGAVLGLMGCANHVRYVSVWTQPLSDTSSVVALTTCDMLGNPIIIVNEHAFRSPEMPAWAWKYHLIHERVHVADMNLHPKGCAGALEQYQKDPNYRMKLELRAKCAEWGSLVRDGLILQVDFSFLGVFTTMWQVYGQHLSKEEFWQKIPCRPP